MVSKPRVSETAATGCGGSIYGFLQEEGVVEETGQEAAGQRADPVDPPIWPVGRGQGGTQGTGGIESAAGEGAGHHDAQRDGEADGEAGDGAD